MENFKDLSWTPLDWRIGELDRERERERDIGGTEARLNLARMS